jgi:hypothetical protein
MLGAVVGKALEPLSGLRSHPPEFCELFARTVDFRCQTIHIEMDGSSPVRVPVFVAPLAAPPAPKGTPRPRCSRFGPANRVNAFRSAYAARRRPLLPVEKCSAVTQSFRTAIMPRADHDFRFRNHPTRSPTEPEAAVVAEGRIFPAHNAGDDRSVASGARTQQKQRCLAKMRIITYSDPHLEFGPSPKRSSGAVCLADIQRSGGNEHDPIESKCSEMHSSPINDCIRNKG